MHLNSLPPSIIPPKSPENYSKLSGVCYAVLYCFKGNAVFFRILFGAASRMSVNGCFCLSDFGNTRIHSIDDDFFQSVTFIKCRNTNVSKSGRQCYAVTLKIAIAKKGFVLRKPAYRRFFRE